MYFYRKRNKNWPIGLVVFEMVFFLLFSISLLIANFALVHLLKFCIIYIFEYFVVSLNFTIHFGKKKVFL